VLFFGCQKERQHFMYRDELEGFQADGVLTHLFTAFSRDQVRCVCPSTCASIRFVSRSRFVSESYRRGFVSRFASLCVFVADGQGLRAAPSARAKEARVGTA
jgi:hypothetical protein